MPLRPAREPARPPRAVGPAEEARVVEVLRCERFVDLAPGEVPAILADEGTYPSSMATMYRVLRKHGEVGERRRQATSAPRPGRGQTVQGRPLGPAQTTREPHRRSIGDPEPEPGGEEREVADQPREEQGQVSPARSAFKRTDGERHDEHGPRPVLVRHPARPPTSSAGRGCSAMRHRTARVHLPGDRDILGRDRPRSAPGSSPPGSGTGARRAQRTRTRPASPAPSGTGPRARRRSSPSRGRRRLPEVRDGWAQRTVSPPLHHRLRRPTRHISHDFAGALPGRAAVDGAVGRFRPEPRA